MTVNNNMLDILPGFVLTSTIATMAWYLGQLIPLVGGPVFGILLGILLAFLKRPATYEAGITFASKKILQVSIILLGFEMNLFNVLKVGSQSLYIIVFTLIAAFVTAGVMGRYLKLAGNTSILIGVGTAICGGSAIAATAPVIAASDKDIAYSISTIFLFNIIAVFLFPILGHVLGMSDMGFGMWAGTAINDTSSVVAAGYSYSHEAGTFATIVKLTRTLMIIPITMVLAVYTAQKNATAHSFNFSKIFPLFIMGFLATSIAGTLELVSPSMSSLLVKTGKFFIVVAMVAIGLKTHLRQLISNGMKPILLGLSCWLAVAVISLVVQRYLVMW